MSNVQTDSDRIAVLEAVVRALIDVYAKGEVEGASVDWEEVDDVVELACDAMPGFYDERLAHYKDAGDDDTTDDEERAYGPAGAPPSDRDTFR
jgi:hypothetical protein